MEILDGKDTIFGNEIVQLKTNKIPKGLVALERVFDSQDSKTMKQSPINKQDLEDVNLGTDSSPRKVYIGKSTSQKIRVMLITLLKKYKHVFTWSYDDLKSYREDLF